ncbi:putative enzyme related to lactoylglutathione lyase [Pseudonocardia cypriaca]|uniref:Putative enzyme related to lactoylglutathione lyase n=2 Tax=Pseudonocardia cypriaca TaxID=882449 RepID=A0A543G9U2_9PSEU|nr:putative enzyme related to lactoylglutathione lyase [Pseudonocardia cypriaca]
MKMLFELVPVPVADIDRAKEFYVKAGFSVDVDVEPAEGVRVCQLTPPGSACSITLTSGLPQVADAVPGSLRGLHLVVADAASAREELARRGVPVGEIEEHPQGVKYVPFSDPDGNTWVLQEMPWRAGDFASAE